MPTTAVHSVIERISFRRVAPGLGFADVRLPDVNLRDLKVERTGNGALRITPPARTDDLGRKWPCYALQPGTREAVEAEIATLWAQSDGRRA